MSQWSVEQLFSRMKEHRGIAIIRDNGRSITYGELLECVDFNYEALQSMLPHSSHKPCIVTINMSLSWRVVPLMLAAFKLHWTVVPISSADEVHLSRPLIAEFPHALHLDRSNVTAEGFIKPSDLQPILPHHDQQLIDVALIIQTSGTSGNPKSIMLTYDNIVSNLFDIAKALQLEPSEQLLIQRPLTYSSALTGELLAGLAAGCSILIKPPGGSPLLTLLLIQKHAITTIGGSPTLFSLLAPHAAKYDLSRLRRIILSGERLTEIQLNSIRAGFRNSTIWNAYGMSEASPRISCLRMDSDRYHPACVGSPLHHVNIAVVDSAGDRVPNGTIGYLLAAGPNIMKGYYNDTMLTREKIRNGWLYTGDMAYVQDGMLVIQGRADHMMNRAGNNVYPEEIESVVTSIPGVHEALAFGLPHPRRGTEIHVWVTCTGGITPSDIQYHLTRIGVDPRLWPDSIEIRSELPKTPTGKLLRNRSISALM